MNFDRMREVILDKAVRGELVSQLAEDGVVAQIGNTPKEELFPIPKSWKWCSLNMVAQVIAGQSPKGTALTTDSNDTEFHQGKTFFGRQYIKNSGAYTNEPTKIAPKESILLSVRAPVGAINLTDRKICIGRGLFAIVPNDQLLVKFLYFVLLTKAHELQSKSTGTTFKAVTGKVVRDLYVPVPPLKEQARIVDKVSDALAEIDRAEKAYQELQTLSGVLRGQILQEAIQGKLVPQLDSEEAVEQIGDAPEDVPFAIPEKWKWVKIKSVFTMQAGKFISASSIRTEGKVPCYGGNGLRGYVDEANRNGHFPLIGRQGALCGNVHVVNGEFYATEHAVVVDCGTYGDPECVGLFLKAMNLNQYATATAQPGLSVKKIVELPFPLPPKSEQVRIASKVKELMKQVEALSGLEITS